MIYSRNEVDRIVALVIDSCNSDWARILGEMNINAHTKVIGDSVEVEAKMAADRLIDSLPNPKMEWSFKITTSAPEVVVLSEGPKDE